MKRSNTRWFQFPQLFNYLHQWKLRKTMPTETHRKTHMKDVSQDLSSDLNLRGEKTKLTTPQLRTSESCCIWLLYWLWVKLILEVNYFHFLYHLRKMHSKQNTKPDPALLQAHQQQPCHGFQRSRIYPFLRAVLWAFNSVTPYSPTSSVR